MRDSAISFAPVGALLRIIPWNCEGIENPWGFRKSEELEEIVREGRTISASSFRNVVRSRNMRVSLKDGDLCVLLESPRFSHPTIDQFQVVPHNGALICVYDRFLELAA